jgi:hypothetical protein
MGLIEMHSINRVAIKPSTASMIAMDLPAPLVGPAPSSVSSNPNGPHFCAPIAKSAAEKTYSHSECLPTAKGVQQFHCVKHLFTPKASHNTAWGREALRAHPRQRHKQTIRSPTAFNNKTRGNDAVSTQPEWQPPAKILPGTTSGNCVDTFCLKN